MKTPNFNPFVSGACLALLFFPLSSQAEIFKWVDGKGQTHYSERKEDAGKVKPEELKVKSQPASTPVPNSSTSDWKEQEKKFKERQAQGLKENTFEAPAVTRTKSLSGGKSDDTASSKCNLARDVLSGAVRHPNGAPTDKYDRDVAKNDVSAFCR